MTTREPSDVPVQHYKDPDLQNQPDGQRSCKTTDCRRQLPLAKTDPHVVCVACRGICSSSNRCEECRDWSPELLNRIEKKQLSLKAKREKAKQKAQDQASVISSGSSSPIPPGQRYTMGDHLTSVSNVGTSISTVEWRNKIDSELAGLKSLLNADNLTNILQSALAREINVRTNTQHNNPSGRNNGENAVGVNVGASTSGGLGANKHNNPVDNYPTGKNSEIAERLRKEARNSFQRALNEYISDNDSSSENEGGNENGGGEVFAGKAGR